MASTILFVHQNFPGQYRHLAPALQARGDRVEAIGGPTARPLPGIPLHRYDPMPPGGVPPCHPWAADLQTKVLRAEAVGRLLERLRAAGLRPDLIVGHPGWGELLAVKDLYPGVPVLHQVEFVYQPQGGDVGFDPEFSDSDSDWRQRTRVRLRRAPQLLALQDLDWGLAPTPWQASTVPEPYRDRLSVIHEGIDTEAIRPEGPAEIRLQGAGLTLRAGDEVVSFVARNLEPYRGFHRFLRALPELQRLRPAARVVIVGGEEVSYGAPPAGGGSWKQVLLAELAGRIDLSRVHFVGRVPHGVLHELFRVCACHVYLTYPFVLSWSLLEAMACGALVIGSATPPVQDVIEHGVNGRLVDFFDSDALAASIAAVLADPAAQRPLRDAARAAVVQRFDLRRRCLPELLALIDQLLAGQMPTTAVPASPSPAAP
ncbi:MAG: glycosyltransferase [Synechococcaceae cyanobacterium]|nr:glycosyltransferase [Synechococcaceae cyanobacterium]